MRAAASGYQYDAGRDGCARTTFDRTIQRCAICDLTAIWTVATFANTSL